MLLFLQKNKVTAIFVAKNILKAMDIKRVIKANKLTVKEVAEIMGITPIGLSQHINGNPSVEVLERIAAAIGCEVGDFFDNSGDFVAFVRRQRETFTFDSEKALIDYAEGLKGNK